MTSNSVSTDTSSAAGHNRKTVVNALEQENREMRFRLERMERMMQQLIRTGKPTQFRGVFNRAFTTPHHGRPMGWEEQPHHGTNRTTTQTPSHVLTPDGRTPRSVQARLGNGVKMFMGTPANSQQQPRGKTVRHPRKNSPSETTTVKTPPQPSMQERGDEDQTRPQIHELFSENESDKSQTLEHVPPEGSPGPAENKR